MTAPATALERGCPAGRNGWRARRPGMGLLVGGLAVCLAGHAAGAADMKEYPTAYYVIYSDLDIDTVREAAVRMTAMAEEYHQRTKGFSGTIRARLPFYLFKSGEDYRAASGPAGSAGVYTGNKLMAYAGGGANTWHTVQHEGFHQFADAVIRGNVPPWVNEGLAEYFGEALYAGDLFVVGAVPPQRSARVKKEIESGQFKSIRDVMAMDRKTWNSNLSFVNYDQAWSMLYFLVHGDGGKYVKALTGFINDASGGTAYEPAWTRNFGRDLDGFEKRWREYWTGLPANPTPEAYLKATVAALTSYFARAYSQQQKFAAPEDFFKAAETGELKANREDYLPPSLLKQALGQVKSAGQWSIETPPGMCPRLVCLAVDGDRYVGSFALNGGRVGHVSVEVVAKEDTPAGKPAPPATRPVGPTTGKATPPTTAKAPPPATQPDNAPPPPAEDAVPGALNLARAYQSIRQTDKARAVLEDALKASPNSPRADEARKLLAELK